MLRFLKFSFLFFALLFGGLNVVFASDTHAPSSSLEGYINNGPIAVTKKAYGPAIPEPVDVPLLPENAPTTFFQDRAPAQWQAMMPLAAQYWGKSPNCPVGVHMVMMTAPSNVGAQAESIGGCVIYLNRSTFYYNNYAWSMCKLIVHEWGHLLGKVHTDDGSQTEMDPGQTMYNARIPICDDLGENDITVSAADQAAAVQRGYPVISGRQARDASLGALKPGWRVRDCKRITSQEVTCNARLRRPKRHNRYKTLTVVLTPNGTSVQATPVSFTLPTS